MSMKVDLKKINKDLEMYLTRTLDLCFDFNLYFYL